MIDLWKLKLTTLEKYGCDCENKNSLTRAELIEHHSNPRCYNEFLENIIKLYYDKDGYDIYGYDIYGYDKDGYNEDGYDEHGYDKDGLDWQGWDKNNCDEHGRHLDDWMGYDENGNEKWRVKKIRKKRT